MCSDAVEVLRAKVANVVIDGGAGFGDLSRLQTRQVSRPRAAHHFLRNSQAKTKQHVRAVRPKRPTQFALKCCRTAKKHHRHRATPRKHHDHRHTLAPGYCQMRCTRVLDRSACSSRARPAAHCLADRQPGRRFHRPGNWPDLHRQPGWQRTGQFRHRAGRCQRRWLRHDQHRGRHIHRHARHQPQSGADRRRHDTDCAHRQWCRERHHDRERHRRTARHVGHQRRDRVCRFRRRSLCDRRVCAA